MKDVLKGIGLNGCYPHRNEVRNGEIRRQGVGGGGGIIGQCTLHERLKRQFFETGGI